MSGILASPPPKRPRTENTLHTSPHNNTPPIIPLNPSSHTYPVTPPHRNRQPTKKVLNID
ncbi:hypothetical protein K469DRAFT_710412 [Zopfia rhizophila CBS 207.26]|uniref:Uncharacterized protein n=1 Tax=Zopfia rhizophila CBS 207.26 TaxID=1314779 RepID=A0A6A6DZI1_9PEZI|nr:hypothetical protein K469DRAFT_710412 [Zopfia rhizophila CBS 207.26]